jgi:undecaprenyl diphosphate synthase
MFSCLTKEPPSIIPNHIAVIPDGNRRYSQRIFMDSVSGYEQSGDSLQRLLNWSLTKGVQELSIFAWSSENWSRPKEEVDSAMEQLQKALDKWLCDEQEDIAYVFISTSLEKLPSVLRVKMHNLKMQTSENSKLTVYIYISYGFSEDVDRRATCRYKSDSVIPNNMSEPDLLIRTSGEQRLSNFCMWHLRYTELMFINPMFPDCDEEVWDSCIDEFSTRKRRYGK